MRKPQSVVVLVILSMSLCGCGRGQDKVVINYCKAIEEGRFDEATTYLSRDAKQMLAMAGGTSGYVEGGKQFKQHRGIKSIDITRRKISGDEAIIEFVYKFNDGSKCADFFPLIKEDGVWKISK